MQPISHLFGAAFLRLRENWLLFFLIYLVAGIWSVFEVITEPDFNSATISTFEWVLYLAAVAIATVFVVLMSIALTYAMAGTATSVKTAYGMALKNFWRYILLSILSVVLVTVSFLLLIVPGIIVSVWIVFAYFVLLLENEGAIASLKRSREYVRGHWWGVFVRLAVLSLVMAVVILASQLLVSFLVSFLPFSSAQIVYLAFTLVLSGFLTPFSLLYVYQMYLELKSMRDGSTFQAQTLT